MAFKNRAGIIWSVSMFSIGRGTAVDSRVVNLFLIVLSNFVKFYINSLGSVTTPVMAAAAATKGPASSVRESGP